MANALTTRTIFDTDMRIRVHLTGIFDGSGDETGVKKVDISTLKAADGSAPNSLDIEEWRWNIQGINSVRILWDHTTDDVALVLNSNGYDDCRNNDPRDNGGNYALADPRSAGGDGSILLTTQGSAANATYDITLTLRKRSQ